LFLSESVIIIVVVTVMDLSEDDAGQVLNHWTTADNELFTVQQFLCFRETKSVGEKANALTTRSGRKQASGSLYSPADRLASSAKHLSSVPVSSSGTETSDTNSFIKRGKTASTAAAGSNRFVEFRCDGTITDKGSSLSTIGNCWPWLFT